MKGSKGISKHERHEKEGNIVLNKNKIMIKVIFWVAFVSSCNKLSPILSTVANGISHLEPEVEITVGHQTFSVHIAQVAELSSVCADICPDIPYSLKFSRIKINISRFG